MISNDINIDKIHSLISKSVDSTLTVDEQLVLTQWIDTHADNRYIYQQLKAIYAVKKLNVPVTGFNDKRKRELIQTVTKRRRMMLVLRSVAAAVLLLSIGIGGFFLMDESDFDGKLAVNQVAESESDSGIRIIRNNQTIKLDNKYEGNDLSYSLDKDKKELSLQQVDAAIMGGQPEKIRIVVDRGHQYKVTLPDSSTVWLNSSSEIAYSAFTDTLRCVELKGEACFDVTHDAKRPFVVKLSSGNYVTVLGTLFNVKSYDNEPTTRIALLSGSVRVETKMGKVLLKPNKEVVIDGKSGVAEVKESVNNNCIAWKDGSFIFDNEYFEDIIRDLSRRYDRTFIIRNEKIKRERLTMNIPQSSLTDMISCLKNAGRGLYTIEMKDGNVEIL